MDRPALACGKAGHRLDGSVSTSSTTGAGPLATSSRSPEEPSSGTPGSGRAATRASDPSRDEATAAARSSTPTPTAATRRATAGRRGGRMSSCAGLVTPLVPDPVACAEHAGLGGGASVRVVAALLSDHQ